MRRRPITGDITEQSGCDMFDGRTIVMKTFISAIYIYMCVQCVRMALDPCMVLDACVPLAMGKLNPEQLNYFFHVMRRIYWENGIALVNQYFWSKTSICCCITLLSASFFFCFCFFFFFVPLLLLLLPLTPLLFHSGKMGAVLFGAKPLTL